MSVDLVSLLYIALIIFVITLVIAMVYVILMLADTRRTVKKASQLVEEVSEKVKAVTSIIDILVSLTGGFEKAKKKVYEKVLPSQSTMVPFFAGLRKGLEVLFGGEENAKKDS